MNNDAKLWQRFLEGDKSSFENLVELYYQPLYDYGLKFTSDRDKVKDHIHDLFTSLWQRRTVLRCIDPVKPYLFKCLRNRIFKEFHRSGILINIDDREDQLPETEDTIETRIISEEYCIERDRRLSLVINTLTRRQKEIIHLKFYEDLSNEEIADILSISRGAVANLLHQTLKLFREKWKLLLYSIFQFYISF